MGVTLRSGFSTIDPSDLPMDLDNNGDNIPEVSTTPPTGSQQNILINQRVLESETEFSPLNADVAQHPTVQQEEEFTLVKRRITRSEPAFIPSLTKKVYPEYTMDELRNMTASQLSEFVNECIRGV